MAIDPSQIRARASAGRGPRHLSAADTSFLSHERAGAHMHFGAISIFEGPAPEQQEFAAHISERLELVPRFRQKLIHSPLPLDRPWWVDDPQFNLDYHVRRSALRRPGGEAELTTLVARLFSQRLDRSKPLWEMYLVEGLEEDRFALITKAHHALVDGISGVDLASVILDSDPPPPQPGDEVMPFVPRPEPSPAELVRRSLGETVKLPLAAAQQAVRAASYPAQVTRSLARASAAVGAMGWELTSPAPPLPLNGPISPHRRYAFRHLDLAAVHAVKTAHGATINDVVVAVATGALRAWLQSRSVATEGLDLRALVPVNLRPEHERGLFGNRVGLFRATLPIGVEDPEERLVVVRDQMRALKRSRQLMAAKTIIGLGAFAPPTILAQAARLNFSTRLFNLMITNVPGPQTPLYLLRRRLRSVAPIAFLPAGHRLSIAVFSYDGQLTFGLLGDYDHMPDLSLLADALHDALPRIDASGALAKPNLASRT